MLGPLVSSSNWCASRPRICSRPTNSRNENVKSFSRVYTLIVDEECLGLGRDWLQVGGIVEKQGFAGTVQFQLEFNSNSNSTKENRQQPNPSKSSFWIESWFVKVAVLVGDTSAKSTNLTLVVCFCESLWLLENCEGHCRLRSAPNLDCWMR